MITTNPNKTMFLRYILVNFLDEQYRLAEELLLELLHIYSPSGQEEAIVKYLMDLLVDRGIDASMVHVSGKSYNVIINDVPSPDILITTHVDTIDFYFSPRIISDHEISGVGACDAKGSIVSILLMLIDMKNLPKSISIAFFSDEECGGSGSIAYLREHTPKNALIMEPTNLQICVGGYGSIEGIITIKTRKLHPSISHQHLSEHSILKTIHIIDDLIQIISKSGAKMTIYSINAGNMEQFIVPDTCEVAFDIAIPIDKNPSDLLKTLLELSKKMDFEISINDYSNPFVTTDSAFLDKLRSSYISTFNREPKFTHMVSWTDANNFASMNIPVAIFGPGDLYYAHSEQEKINIKDIILAAKYLKNLIKRYF